jgi:hypothetical protein
VTRPRRFRPPGKLAATGQPRFNRGGFYFRCEPWTVEEMEKVMSHIAEPSVVYYFCKYREATFLQL